MSSLPIFVINEHVISNVSMSSSITSHSVEIAEVTGFCVHSIWTGSPVGSIVIEGSNDDVNFVQVTSSLTAPYTQYLANLENQHYRYVRVSYTRTSGTGSLTVYVSAKRNG